MEVPKKQCEWKNQNTYEDTIDSWMAWKPQNNCDAPDGSGMLIGKTLADVIGSQIKPHITKDFCSTQSVSRCYLSKDKFCLVTGDCCGGQGLRPDGSCPNGETCLKGTCEEAIPGNMTLRKAKAIWLSGGGTGMGCYPGSPFCGIPYDCATSKISGACKWEDNPNYP